MKNLMMTTLRACCALLIILGIHSCVKEEICEANHPHMGTVSFNYNLENLYESAYIPVDMRIACNKIIFTNITNLSFDITKNSGKFLTNKPSSITKAQNHDLTVFPIVSGEYKFFTMNMGLQSFDFTELEAYLATARTANLGTKWVKYKLYERDSPEIDYIDGEWIDFNKYHHSDGDEAEFIMPTAEPLIVDTTRIMNLGLNEHVDVTFKPMMLTHNIDIYFDINKEVEQRPFIIDSVLCVISGVPGAVNVGTGALDVANTNKVVYKGMLVTPKEVPSHLSQPIADTRDNPKVRVYRNMNILGIIENENMEDEEWAGPGVLQTLIYMTIFDDPEHPEGRKKRLNGMVNIHNSLLNAKLQTYNAQTNVTKKSRAHSDLYIKMDLTISEAQLKIEDDGGIDHWIEIKHDQGEEFDIY